MSFRPPFSSPPASSPKSNHPLSRLKTRIVHVSHGFEFLGYKIKRGTRPLRLSPEKIRSGLRQGALYAIPRQKSVEHFKDQIR